MNASLFDFHNLFVYDIMVFVLLQSIFCKQIPIFSSQPLVVLFFNRRLSIFFLILTNI